MIVINITQPAGPSAPETIAGEDDQWPGQLITT